MRSHTLRRSSAIAVTAAALLLVGCSDDGDGGDGGSTTTATAAEVTSIDLVVRDGVVVGGVERHDLPLDGTVTVTVTADVAEEAHVHGYDHLLVLEPGVPASVTFTADIPGVFEIELEGDGTLLAELATS